MRVDIWHACLIGERAFARAVPVTSDYRFGTRTSTLSKASSDDRTCFVVEVVQLTTTTLLSVKGVKI